MKSSTGDAVSKARRFLRFVHADSDFLVVGKSTPDKKWLGYEALDPRDEATLATLIEGAETTNIFVTPAEMDGSGNCQETNVVGSRVAWVDIDPPKEEDELSEHLEWLKTTALPELKELGAWVNRSGREGGRHAYIKLDRSAAVDELRALNKLLASRYRGDKCWNPNRVLRLPGTINHKTGETVRRSIGKNTKTWDPEELAAELGADKPLSELAEIASTPLDDIPDNAEPEPIDWKNYPAKFKRLAVREPNNRFADHDFVPVQRHMLIAGSVKECCRYGLSFEQTLWVLGHCKFAVDKAREERKPLSHYVAYAWKNPDAVAIRENTDETSGPVEDEYVPEFVEDEYEASEVDDSRFKRLDWSASFSKDFSHIDWLLGKFMERGQQVALVADGKAGKSLFIQHWCFALTLGWDFLGDEARKPLRVLYFDKENSERDVITRARALGVKPEDHSRLSEEFDYRQFPRFNGTLDDPQKQAYKEFFDIVDEAKPDVVIIDTASRFIGGSENESNTWLQLYQLIHEPLKKRGIACVRLDHFGKDSSAGGRGSSAKSQDVDHVWEMVAKAPVKSGDEEKTILTLKRTHTRTGYGNAQFVVTRSGVKDEKGMWSEGKTTHTLEVLGSGEPVTETNVRAAEKMETQDEIYFWIQDQPEPPSTTEIQSHFSHLSKTTVRNHLDSLLRDMSGRRITKFQKPGEEGKTKPQYYRVGG